MTHLATENGAKISAGLLAVSPWTLAKTAKLRRLWIKGLSASAIAHEIGDDITRNMVIGKANRLDLPAHAAAGRYWTKHETATLYAMRAERKTIMEIADVIGRTPNGVKRRVHKLRIPRGKKQAA